MRSSRVAVAALSGFGFVFVILFSWLLINAVEEVIGNAVRRDRLVAER